MITPAKIFKKDTWNYIIGSYDGNTVRIFLDGDLVAIRENQTTHSDFNSGIHIGNSHSTYGFKGWLDEVMILNYGFDGKELK